MNTPAFTQGRIVYDPAGSGLSEHGVHHFHGLVLDAYRSLIEADENSAYDVSGATVNDHAVWWLWPNTCLLRYPGRGNFMVFQIIPAGPDRTLETWDFYLETPEPNEAEVESIRYIDDVLQQQDISLVESVQRGMRTPAFTQGRIVYDPAGSGLSEHGVHHFHGLVLDAYRSLVGPGENRPEHDGSLSSLSPSGV